MSLINCQMLHLIGNDHGSAGGHGPAAGGAFTTCSGCLCRASQGWCRDRGRRGFLAFEFVINVSHPLATTSLSSFGYISGILHTFPWNCVDAVLHQCMLVEDLHLI